jgi:hypothetical protein
VSQVILRICGPEAGNTFTVELESEVAGKLRLEGDDYSGLTRVGAAVRSSLESTEFGQHPLHRDRHRALLFLEEIRRRGDAALAKLVSLSTRGHQLQQFCDFFLDVIKRPSAETPTLVVEADVDLPLDIMPVFRPRARFDANATEPEALAAQAEARFLGLHFAVRKTLGHGGNGTDLRIRTEATSDGPRVAMAPYWHRSLYRVGGEIADLKRLPFCEVDLPRPDESMFKMNRWEAEQMLSDELVRGRDGRVGIVHVTSHCDTSGESAYDHALVMGEAIKIKDRLTLKESSLRVTVLAIDDAAEVPRRTDGPLAFLNACGANNVRFDSPLTIPEALISAGYRAVISPLVSVHVEPAHALAMHFYEELTKRETNVGTALVAARRRLLASNCSTPLGLLYSCYGETGLRLDEEVAETPSQDRVLV